ncbi:MAG: helix-turn-helix domain-containing protein [Acetatifactor sp.]|nr:helix-turn-helix domain-containing protein [Acetatifactor sp.]
MFDTMKVAREIREARIAQNMTQMNLADAMGVSYQAVSNWERGNSMPDIGKLEELCEILDISLDRLLGVQRQVQNVQKVIDYTSGKIEETLSLEEIRDAVPLMEPEQVQRCVGNTAEETERISLDELIGLAPFAGKGTLKKLAEKVEEVNLDELVGLAPFVDRETLNRLAEKIDADEICPDELCGLAPFVSKDTLENLAGNIKKEKIDLNALQGLASFLGKDKLEELLRRVYGS